MSRFRELSSESYWEVSLGGEGEGVRPTRVMGPGSRVGVQMSLSQTNFWAGGGDEAGTSSTMPPPLAKLGIRVNMAVSWSSAARVKPNARLVLKRVVNEAGVAIRRALALVMSAAHCT